MDDSQENLGNLGIALLCAIHHHHSHFSHSLKALFLGDHICQKASRQNLGKLGCRRLKRPLLSRNYKMNSRKRNVLKFRGISMSHHTLIHLHVFVHARRKEITVQRKKAAEERLRLEEAKAKVCHVLLSSPLSYPLSQ
jgi:hypothetical protein